MDLLQTLHLLVQDLNQEQIQYFQQLHQQVVAVVKYIINLLLILEMEDQVVAEMVLLELVNLDQMVKVAVAEAVALDNHLLEAAEMVS